ncbi:hypothetical protein GF382_03050 [Candidatus Falkowbacteria bacterium]|nr:hypothetical protein [Candidatus Falkowbacteria bacterium]
MKKNDKELERLEKKAVGKSEKRKKKRKPKMKVSGTAVKDILRLKAGK